MIFNILWKYVFRNLGKFSKLKTKFKWSVTLLTTNYVSHNPFHIIFIWVLATSHGTSAEAPDPQTWALDLRPGPELGTWTGTWAETWARFTTTPKHHTHTQAHLRSGRSRVNNYVFLKLLLQWASVVPSWLEANSALSLPTALLSIVREVRTIYVLMPMSSITIG